MNKMHEAAQELAKMTIDKMRGGSLLDVGPQRSEAILTAMFEEVLSAAIKGVMVERESCIDIIRRNAHCGAADAEAVIVTIRARGK